MMEEPLLQTAEQNDDLALARGYGDAGDFESALTHAEAALKNDPRNLEALYLRGAAHFQLKNLAQAMKDWETVLRNDPQNAFAREGLEAVSEALDNPDEPLRKKYIGLWAPYYLLVRPAKFFLYYAEKMPVSFLFLLILLSELGLGISLIACMGIVDISEFQRVELFNLHDDTLNFLLFCGVWVLMGAFDFGLCGAWFWLRARLSGCGPHCYPDTIKVYFSARSICSVFAIAVFFFWGIPAYLSGDDPHEYLGFYPWVLGFAGLIALLSINCAYKGVTAMFPVRRSHARFWFLAVPIVLGAGMLMGIGYLTHQATYTPTINKTEKLHDYEPFTLKYPQNWLEDYPWLDDDIYYEHIVGDAVTISPLDDPAFFCLVLYPEKEERASLYEDLMGLYFNNPDAVFGGHMVEERTEATAWGALEGLGSETKMEFRDEKVRFFLFVTDAEEQSAALMWYCPAKDYERLKPGFELIEKTIAVKASEE